VNVIDVPNSDQVQFRQELLVAPPTPNPTPNTLKWTVFRNVSVVNSNVADGAQYSLRAALEDAKNPNATSRPWLIRFNHTASRPVNATLTDAAPLEITAPGTVIDGTDPSGHPSPLMDFKMRMYRARIRQDPSSKGVENAAKFSVKAPGVQFIGLSIQRTLGTEMELDGLDQDLVTFGNATSSVDARNGRVSTCLLDGGAATRENPVAGQGKDCVDAEGTLTTSFEDAVVIENSELRYCYDRAAKSQDGYLVLRDNWIHNNIRGGPFAQMDTPMGGRIKTERNLIEHNGKNCPMATNPTFSGDPANCGGEIWRDQVRSGSSASSRIGNNAEQCGGAEYER
jgi:hypothetical protein